jgi:DNA-binding response OmpR family regulator
MATVLIVDDDVFFTRVIKDMVSRLGHRPLTAQDGERALSTVHRDRPDLVITDVVMKPMDGFELCRRLQATEGLDSIPVLLMSARGGGERRARGAELGAVAFLEKPFELEELSARIKRLLEVRARPSGSPAENGAGPSAGRITGDLADIDAVLLLQGLNIQAQTGRLTVAADGDAPEVQIWMRDGEVVAAEEGDAFGIEVLRRLARRPSGAFRFEKGGLMPPERSVEGRFFDVMMAMVGPD